MAGRGQRVIFHGAFGSKARAKTKERQVRGGYVRTATVQGHRRYMVLSRKER